MVEELSARQAGQSKRASFLPSVGLNGLNFLPSVGLNGLNGLTGLRPHRRDEGEGDAGAAAADAPRRVP